ncbi:hypothetical protein HMPREF1544_08262 [Mucor circinelloides 1006PhL]|uniref:Uncharacterized protein n=1 Tax=Mucor circinelloides f. circinelloides (strain 1006PhL) TaxID=1220926 RepID=S2J5Q5_MUCC1|nr:hypothetical protein HMPREF1544_08262 [Mucor circinelloides 1006PhL]
MDAFGYHLVNNHEYAVQLRQTIISDNIENNENIFKLKSDWIKYPNAQRSIKQKLTNYSGPSGQSRSNRDRYQSLRQIYFICWPKGKHNCRILSNEDRS